MSEYFLILLELPGLLGAFTGQLLSALCGGVCESMNFHIPFYFFTVCGPGGPLLSESCRNLVLLVSLPVLPNMVGGCAELLLNEIAMRPRFFR